MNNAIDKPELLQRLHSGYSQFQQLIAGLDSTHLQALGVIGDWSIKDVIAHFIAHEQFALNEITAAQRGEQYQTVFPSTDAMNARAVEEYAGAAPEQVLDAWKTSFQQVVAVVESLTDADFAADSALVRVLGDTIDGALANNTYEHYAEHTPAVKHWIAQH